MPRSIFFYLRLLVFGLSGAFMGTTAASAILLPEVGGRLSNFTHVSSQLFRLDIDYWPAGRSGRPLAQLRIPVGRDGAYRVPAIPFEAGQDSIEIKVSLVSGLMGRFNTLATAPLAITDAASYREFVSEFAVLMAHDAGLTVYTDDKLSFRQYAEAVISQNLAGQQSEYTWDIRLSFTYEWLDEDSRYQEGQEAVIANSSELGGQVPCLRASDGACIANHFANAERSSFSTVPMSPIPFDHTLMLAKSKAAVTSTPIEVKPFVILNVYGSNGREGHFFLLDRRQKLRFKGLKQLFKKPKVLRLKAPRYVR